MQDNVPLNKDKDITYFGKTNFRGSDRLFGIKRKDRRQHMYVLGKSGTGKSVLMSNMIVQNIRNGEGVCVVDPHGELVEEILHSIPEHRLKDVIYFNPADTDYHIGFNVLQLDDPRYKHLVASGLMGIFTKIWANAWSSRMEYILNNAILALLDTPGTTLLGIPRILVDKDYRQVIINNLKDPVVKAFWVHEYEAWRDQFRNEAIAPIQNKVGQFLSTSIVRNVVGQSKSTIDIFDIMNSGKIFIVNVSKGRIGEDNSALLGGMIITKIQLAAMERVRIPEKDRRDFYLYVDEFQNFVTDSFASILSEARKYRLNLTIAHQYIGQLVTDAGTAVRDAVFGNVGTMIVFRVGAADADFLEKEFEPEFTPEDVVNLPNYHIYLKLMVDGITSRPFSAKTLPPIEIDETAGVADGIIAASRANYTRPREVVEDEINRWSGMVMTGGGGATGEPETGKFKAECSNCKKSIYVPFEPEPGRPVYCKDCLFKIKNGELQPTSGFKPPREKRDETSYDALAGLGIEFTAKPGTVAPRGPIANKVFNKIVDSQTKAPPIKQSQDFQPIAPKPPFKKPEESRTKPDVAGLQNVIKDALSNTIIKDITQKPAPIQTKNIPVPISPVKPMIAQEQKAAIPQMAPPIRQTFQPVRPVQQAEVKESQNNNIPKQQSVPMPAKAPPPAPKTLSLSDLKKDEQKNMPTMRAMPVKDASEDKMSALKLAVANALGDRAPGTAVQPSVAPEAQNAPKLEQPQAGIKTVLDGKMIEEESVEDKHLKEEKKKIEQEIQAAQMRAKELEEKAQKLKEEQMEADRHQKAEEAERITKEKEAEYARKVEEEKKRIEEELQAKERERLEGERKRAEAEALQAQEPATAMPNNKKKREVPEDILRKVLE